MIGIYRIYHKETQKSYVGMSRDIEKRIRDHFFAENRDLSIRGAIDKHGTDAFAYEILEVCQPDLLNFRECHWIASLDCIAPNGYNLTSGGDGGFPSEIVKKKMSESAKLRCQNKAHLQKMSDAQKGKRHSEATRRKMSATHKQLVKSEEHQRKLKTNVPKGNQHYSYRHDLRKNAKELYVYYCKTGSYRAVARKFNTAPLLAENIIKDYISTLA